jgi:hypothetical protein
MIMNLSGGSGALGAGGIQGVRPMTFPGDLAPAKRRLVDLPG